MITLICVTDYLHMPWVRIERYIFCFLCALPSISLRVRLAVRKRCFWCHVLLRPDTWHSICFMSQLVDKIIRAKSSYLLRVFKKLIRTRKSPKRLLLKIDSISILFHQIFLEIALKVQYPAFHPDVKRFLIFYKTIFTPRNLSLNKNNIAHLRYVSIGLYAFKYLNFKHLHHPSIFPVVFQTFH